MSNAITTPVSALESLSVARTSKAGKTTTRTAIGIALSGNKAEKETLAFAVAEEFWFGKANIFPFMAELNRVFPTLKKTIEARNDAVKQVASENPGVKLNLVNLRAPKKIDVLAMFVCARNLTGADKGAKAQLLAVMQHIADLEDSLAVAKAERTEAFQASQATPALTT